MGKWNIQRWKEGIFLLPAVGICLLAVGGYATTNPTFSRVTFPSASAEPTAGAKEADTPAEVVNGEKVHAKKEKITKVTYTKNGTWKDGTYTGSGTGYGGTITVSVTIQYEKITDIRVLSHAGETDSFYQKAEAIVDRILQAQTPDVDTVSGATYSSNGIRTAVAQALQKAGGKSLVVTGKAAAPEKTESPKHTSKPAAVKGKPADGVYSGSSLCEKFDYTVHLQVKFHGGKIVAVRQLRITGNEDPANQAYWTKAWKPMVSRLLKKQTADVDVVSGATYSSEAIKAAYMDAYRKAVRANGGKTDTPGQNAAPTAAPKETETAMLPVPTAVDTAAQPAAGSIKDGTYTVSAVCSPDQDEDFMPYTLTAKVTFAEGKLTGIDGLTSTDESNKTYYMKAANGTAKRTGVVVQLIQQQNMTQIQAVSGATCSSKTLLELYAKALTEATGVEQNVPQETKKPSSGAEASAAPSPGAADTAEPSMLPVPTGIPALQPSSTAAVSPVASTVPSPAEPGKPLPAESMEPEPTPVPLPTESVEPEPMPAPSPTASMEPVPTAVPSVTPVPSPAETAIPQESASPAPDGYKDGVYTVSTTVSPDEDEDFDEYTMTADVVFINGTLANIIHVEISDITNQIYCKRALNGTKAQQGILAQLKQDPNRQADAVSGATCSSNALIDLYEQACRLAEQ